MVTVGARSRWGLGSPVGTGAGCSLGPHWSMWPRTSSGLASAVCSAPLPSRAVTATAGAPEGQDGVRRSTESRC